MSDKLEKFISDSRQSFDIYEPSPELWENISNNINSSKNDNEKRRGKIIPIKLKSVLYKAATVAIIISISVITLEFLHEKNINLFSSNNDDINIPELKEAEHYYSSMVNSKLKEVKPMLSVYPGLNEELEHELSELDSMYQGLKMDLKDNVATNEVIEAMIQNYRIRLSILEEILTEIKEAEERSTNHDNNNFKSGNGKIINKGITEEEEKNKENSTSGTKIKNSNDYEI